jgi:hypothetical protein
MELVEIILNAYHISKKCYRLRQEAHGIKVKNVYPFAWQSYGG